MSVVWEYQIEGWAGTGWKGWRVTVATVDGDRTFAFDERDGIVSEQDAREAALAYAGADSLPEVKVIRQIRTLVSAEINPN